MAAIPVEFEDAPCDVRAAMETVCELVGKAKHLVCLNGAGMSTSAGIPDNRGTNGRLARRHFKRHAVEQVASGYEFPTLAHVVQVALQDEGYLKHVVTTNTDGLEAEAGVVSSKLSALRGVATRRRCRTKPRVLRSRARVSDPQEDRADRWGQHGDGEAPAWAATAKTAEFVDTAALATAEAEMAKADCVLCIGCSMTVAIQDIVQMRRPGAPLILITMQETPADGDAAVCVHARADTAMMILAARLGLSVPRYAVQRSFVIGNTHLAEERIGKRPQRHHWRLFVKSLADGPADLEQVLIEMPPGCNSKDLLVTSNPFEIARASTQPLDLRLTLFFERVPGEKFAPYPPVTVPYRLSFDGALTECVYDLAYDPWITQAWEIEAVVDRPSKTRPIFTSH